MRVDHKDMINYGFIFSSATYAAMAAVNKPNSVLVVSKTNFLSPIAVGEDVYFEATSRQKDTRKRNVMVIGYLNNIKFFEGEFIILVLEHHPLSLKLE